METNKKLQNLIGKIIGKDYFKLEMGCKIKTKDGEHIFTGLDGLNISYNGGFKTIDEGCGCCSEASYYNKEDCEILGQEPTLNDVLLAIGKKGYEITCGIDENIMVININNNLIPLFINKSIFNQEESVKVALIGLLEGK